MSQRIVYATDDGIAVIVPSPDCGLSIDDIAAKDVPIGASYSVFDSSEIPEDRTFRGAWEINGNTISESLVKAKMIAHEKRREKRSKELAPLDIEATIPMKAAAAEAQRQSIRDKYADVQINMDGAQDTTELRSILAAM